MSIKKIGRPQKAEEDRKEARLQVVLSHDEYRALKAIAVSTSRTMGQVIRDWIAQQP